MRSRLTLFWVVLVLSLFIFGMVGCGGDDNPSDSIGVAGSSRSENSAADQTTSDTPQTTTAPNTEHFTPEVTTLLQELPGALVYLQGDTLNLLDFQGDLEPVVLAEAVLNNSFAFNPSHSAVIYEIDDGLYAYDLSKGRSVHLGETNFGIRRTLISWSPNGQWFIRYLAGTWIYNMNGEGYFDIGGLRRGSIYRWTTDNQLIIIADNGRQGDNHAYKQVSLFDTEGFSAESIEIDLDAVNNGEHSLEAALYDMGYELVPPSTEEHPRIQIPQAVSESPSTICNIWSIADGDSSVNAEVIYESPLIYMLSELSTYMDDDLYFLKWTVEDCGPNQPDASLVRYRLSTSDEEVLIEDIFADFQPARDNVIQYVGEERTVQRYAISPNGQFIVWLGGSVENQRTSFNLLDLATGENTVIFELNGAEGSNRFTDTLLLSEVYWLQS